MKKKIMMWFILICLVILGGFLFAKTEGSIYGLLLIIVLIILGIVGPALLYREELNTSSPQYSELKREVIYKTLFSCSYDLFNVYGKIPYLKYNDLYLVWLQEQDGSKNIIFLDKKPPTWFKYTGDPNNPYEVLPPQ